MPGAPSKVANTVRSGDKNQMTRRIVAVAYPGIVLLDLVGPCEVFAIANRIAMLANPDVPKLYEVEVISAGAELRVEASSGLTLLASRSLADMSDEIDTLLVPGAIEPNVAAQDDRLLQWLRDRTPGVRRVGSVCTGAFVLAAAGLLEGRSATTHWHDCRQLTRDYPGIRVEPDRIYVKDGKVYTSAGVTAGMDLALAMVEEDLGREVALRAAKALVMFVRRPGGQSQFSTLLQSQDAERQPLRELVEWIAEHLEEDLSVEVLALRVHMSVRNFSRAFRRELGKTPARYVEAVRVEAARRKLEEGNARVDSVAKECGLASGNSMLRSFLRVLGVPPSEYRERFRRTVTELH